MAAAKVKVTFSIRRIKETQEAFSLADAETALKNIS